MPNDHLDLQSRDFVSQNIEKIAILFPNCVTEAAEGKAIYENIDKEFAKAIAADNPMRIVFRNSGFSNDTAKTNVKQLLKQLSPGTEMKVI